MWSYQEHGSGHKSAPCCKVARKVNCGHNKGKRGKTNLTEISGWARLPIQRMVVYAPAAPRTPSNATAIADHRCAAVGS